MLDRFIWELPIGSVFTANYTITIGRLQVRGGYFLRLAEVDPKTGACCIEHITFTGGLDSNTYDTTRYWLDWEQVFRLQRACGLGADSED